MLSRFPRPRLSTLVLATFAAATFVSVAHAQYFTKSTINDSPLYNACVSLVTDPYDQHAAYVGQDGSLHYGVRSEVTGNWTNSTFSVSGTPVALALQPVTKVPYIVVAEASSNGSDLGHVVVLYRSGNYWYWDVVRPVGDGEPFGLTAEEVAITFAADGTPYVSYTMSGNGYDSLKVAHKSGSSWIVELADVQGNHDDIAIRVHPTTGQPRVSFSRYDWYVPDYDLIYKERNSGGTWTETPIETNGITGNPQSLAQDASGNPAIAYVRNQETRLIFAKRDPTTGVWSKELLDLAAPLTGSVSLAMDTNSRPHIAYRTAGWDSVKYCTKACGSWRFVRMFASQATSQTARSSVTLGLWANRHPRIAWDDTPINEQAGKYQFATAQIGCGGGGGGGVIPPESATPPVAEPTASLGFGVRAPGTAGGAIRLTLGHSASVALTVHDLAGRRIASRDLGVQSAGVHELVWPMTELPTGLYFLRAVTSEGERAEARWVIVR